MPSPLEQLTTTAKQRTEALAESARLTEELRGLVEAAKGEHTMHEIAAAMGMSRQSVYRLIRRYS